MWAQISYLNVSKIDEGGGGRRFPHVLSWDCRCCTDWKEMDGWKYYCYKLHSDALRYLNVSKMEGGDFPHVLSWDHRLNRDWSLMDGSWKYYWRWITLKPCGFKCGGSTIVNLPSDEKLYVMCGINSGSHKTPFLSENSWLWSNVIANC